MQSFSLKIQFCFMLHYNFGWNFAHYLANVRYNYIKTKNKSFLEQIKKGAPDYAGPLSKKQTLLKLTLSPAGGNWWENWKSTPPELQCKNILHFFNFQIGEPYNWMYAPVGMNFLFLEIIIGILECFWGVLECFFKKNLPFLENPYPAISLFGLQNCHCKV